MNALGQEDALGLRERLLIAYDHPRFVRSAQLQEACLRIPAATLHDYLAKRLWPLHVMHHPHHPPAERFASDLNYKWVQYIPGTMGLLNSSGRTSTIALLSKRPLTKLTSRQQKKLASGKPGTFASHSQSTIFDSLLQMPALKLGTKRCPGKQPRQACSSALGWIQSLQNLICTASLPSLPPLRLLLPVQPLSRQLPLPETSCVASLPSTQWKGFSPSPTSTSSTFAP